MPTCATYDQLLDSVYGLLDEREQQALTAHLADCPACRELLADVRQDQSLFARAARPIDDVPAFARPSAEPQPLPAPATLPLPAPLPLRPRSRRPVLALAACAAALLLGIGTWVSFESGRRDYEGQIAGRREDVTAIDARLATLQPTFEREQEKLVRDARTSVLQVHAIGPQQLHADGAGILTITTRDTDGQPAPGIVDVRVARPTDGKVLFAKTLPSKGQARVELPRIARNDAESAQLVVEARTSHASARVQESLATTPPSYVAHLAANKAIYQVGEPLFFRALALQRFGLQPPAEPLKLRAELVDPAGTTVARTEGTTDAGIFAGQLALDDAILSGDYSLRVQAVDSATALTPQALSLEVTREPPTEYQLDKDRYKAGEAVNLVLSRQNRALQIESAKVGGISVPQQMPGGLGGAGVPAPAGNEAAKADDGPRGLQAGFSKANAQLQTNIPRNFTNRGSVKAEIAVRDGAHREIVNVRIPLTPSQLAIDFYPEGGDLVAGVPCRVYYRVHAPTGEADDSAGRVTLLAGKETIDSERQAGLGSFTFTPNPRETYIVRITSPAGTTDVAQPFARLGIRTEGLVLHAPDSVSKEGQPLRLTLRNQGRARRVLVLAECRGVLVDQQWVEIKGATTDVVMQPAAGVRGIVRLTAYEAAEERLIPLAERLVYRAPAEALALDVAETGAATKAGATARWTVTASDEKGQPAAARVLAAVVDERFRPRERALPMHFFFAGELSTSRDLEDAPLAVRDTDEARQQLDRFLGTHGWRRFVSAAPTALARLAAEPQAPGKPADSLTSSSAPRFFSRDNGTLEQLRQQAETRRDLALAPLRDDTARQQRELGDEKTAALAALNIARTELAAHEFQAREYLRLAVLGLLGALLAIAVAALVLGMIRTARRSGLATSAFAGAFVCMLAGLGLFVLLQDLRTPERNPVAQLRDPAMHPQEPLPPQERLAAKAAQAHPEPLVPSGDYADAPLAFAEGQNGRGRPMERGAAQAAGAALGADMQFANARRAEDLRQDTHVAKNQHELFNRRLKDQELRKQGRPAAPAPHPAAAPGALAEQKAATAPEADRAPDKDAVAASRQGVNRLDQSRDREYRYAPALPPVPADTLLWRPALILPDGTATLTFDMPTAPAVYRVVLFGHTLTGRLGFYESRLELPAGKSQP